MLRVAGLVLASALPLGAQQTSPALRVLPERAPGNRAPSPLYERLHAWAGEALDRRETAYEVLKTPEQIAAWQQARRRLFLQALGELPPRTPLRARTVGKLEGNGFRVENVLFESRPGHHVAANLYLPLTRPPYPAVLIPCGHSYTGKAGNGNQRMAMLLARNGIAALSYDPIGQGERYQTFGRDGRPLGAGYTGSPSSVAQLRPVAGGPRFNPVEEHTLVGIGSILVGTSTAAFRIHDGLRAVDYLVSRADVDPKRIGCTGNSGGGTLTGYLMALDDRIACAAPTCSLTTFRRLLATSGPQDAEQNLFGQLRDGLDEADYVLLRAPRPTALCAGTRDATFDITGTWDLYREAKRIYGRLGFPERMALVEADEPHGFSQPLRVGAARWLRRWLLGVDEPITEPDLPIYTPAELQCTPHGQVMLLPGEVSAFEFNRRRAGALAPQRRRLWAGPDRSRALQRVRELAGIRPLAEIPAVTVRSMGQVEEDGYRIEKLLLGTDTKLELPALAFFPRGGRITRRVLYLHSEGKQAEAGPGGALAALARDGALVLAVDLAGLGETGIRHPRDWGGALFGPNTQEFFLAHLLGRSLVGMRAEEALAAVRFLAGHGASDAAGQAVEVVAVGPAGAIPIAHAAALEPALFSRVTLRGCPPSWLSVLEDPTAGTQLTHVVHAALTAYDLPDLLSAIPRDRLVREPPARAARR